MALAELLCPLKHPSELCIHPTLSLPFLDPALPDMVRSTEDKLRQERANLWRAKNLSRQFMGDESWMPSENTESVDDWDIFEPKPRIAAQHAGKKRKRDFENEISRNGINGHDHAESAHDDISTHPEEDDLEIEPEENVNLSVKKLSGADSQTVPAPAQPQEEQRIPDDEPPTTNGVHNDSKATEPKGNGEHILRDKDNLEDAQDVSAQTDPQANEEEEEADEAISEDEAVPPPTRRITRALAAEHNDSNAATPPLSPNSTTSSIDSYLLRPDPLFLLPPILAADQRAPRNLLRLGIPVDELMETRRLLTMYIQKQEESVRGYEALLGKLIKAKRMRDNVWEWAKAEGHVGELSDGEDWIDAGAWGLQLEDLKKGTDEENNEAQEDTAGGRKGKRRRRE